MQVKRTYSKGTVIIHQGDYGDEAYEICTGSVEVSYKNSQGNNVKLAVLKAPHMFGEMALIDEKPRSATVIALTNVEVYVTQKSTFLKYMQLEQTNNLVPILRSMFERLRTTNHVLSSLSSDMALGGNIKPGLELKNNLSLCIKPLTDDARNALGSKRYDVTSFPFRIGRKDENDVLGINDLVLSEEPPFKVSPHHILIAKNNNEIELSDRGSRFGSLINGKRIGLTNRSKVIKLKVGENEVILGDIYSKMRFNFEVS